jgi:uncharacterized membrane protein
MRWHGDDPYKSGGIVESILKLVFFLNLLALLGLTLIWVIRGLSKSKGETETSFATDEADPLKIAGLRLAVGEITEKEFAEIRARLQS